MKSTICLAEDREVCEPSLKLLLASLNVHGCRTAINLFYPPARNEFVSWIKKYPEVRLQTGHLANGYGWNVKPQAIMSMMDQGYDEVIWIDSDVIVTRNMLHIFGQLKNDIVVVTEDAISDERDDRNALRARLWKLPVGRILPFGLNTGVLRVTKENYNLMERWWELLQSAQYQDFQKREWRKRPIHMLGDQDVLTALLTSKEFSEIPVQILRRGKDILQFNGIYGYTVAERVRNLLGDCPTFIHSFAGKPWSERWGLRQSYDLRDYIKRVYLDLSPYTLSAKHFRDKLDCDTEWMEPHYALSRVLRVLGMGCRELVGLPIAIFMDLARILKYTKKACGLNPARLETGRHEVGKR